METVAIENQWIEKFQAISKEENNSSTKITKNDLHPRGPIYDNTERKQMLNERRRQFLEQRKMRMIRMQPLFASQPRLEIICQNWNNGFVDSGFTTYNFFHQATQSFESREDDLKYMIKLCGCNLTKLDLYNYPSSRIMPLIKSKCLNLTALTIRFKEVESKDFDNVFSNMSHLETLIIHWQRDNSSLPMTLVKSLEQVCETLKSLVISCDQEDLEEIVISVSSILSPETEALMAVIGNMKNLESAKIELDYGVTDELIINLTNNSKNLKFLHVCGSNITDKGLIALNKFNQLKDFNLGLRATGTENKSITDQSIQCLSNNTIVNLNISECIQVTNSSVIELVKNLPNLKILCIENTKATIDVVKEIIELKRNSELLLTVLVSFEINDDITEYFTNRTVSFISSFEK